MSNILRRAKKELKAYAKQNKKISISMVSAVSLLMTGNLVNEDEVDKKKKMIDSTIDALNSNISILRRKREKLLQEKTLELIQSEDQINQVIENTWKTWEFGLNHVYNTWGHANRWKKEKIVKERNVKKEFVGKYTNYKSKKSEIQSNLNRKDNKLVSNKNLPSINKSIETNKIKDDSDIQKIEDFDSVLEIIEFNDPRITSLQNYQLDDLVFSVLKNARSYVSFIRR